MAQLLEYLKMAVDNIRGNKGRSFLTMLGIIIGISSVIMIIGIGNGAQAQINDELSSMGGNQISVSIDSTKEISGADRFTKEDLEVIGQKVNHVEGVSPAMSFFGSVRANNKTYDTYITAGSPDIPKFLGSEKIKTGRFFNQQEFETGKNVCVISDKDAKKIFGTDDVIGMTLDLSIDNRAQSLKIIGITHINSSGMLSFAYESDSITVYAPYYFMESGYGFQIDNFDSFYIASEGVKYSKAIANDVITMLELRHNRRGDNIYIVEDMSSTLDQINSVLSTITIFIIFVAAISLLVGGIGVMNIMLVSVTERTREIGIRKALGARTGSIMMQFLSESAIITLIGGIIGIIIGVGGAFAICAIPILGFAPKISAGTILVATIFSSAVGIFFGIYPARKAAKMSPIDALRFN